MGKPKTTTVLLTLRVQYTPNSTSNTRLAEVLRKCVDIAVDKGHLVDGVDAEVETWSTEIAVVVPR